MRELSFFLQGRIQMGAVESSPAEHPLCGGGRHPLRRRGNGELSPSSPRIPNTLLAESKVRLLAAQNSEEMRSRLRRVFDPEGPRIKAFFRKESQTAGGPQFASSHHPRTDAETLPSDGAESGSMTKIRGK